MKAQRLISLENIPSAITTYTSNEILFVTNELSKLLGVDARTMREWTSKMTEPVHKFNHRIQGEGRATTVLTIEGIRWIFENKSIAKNISNKKELLDYFNKLYVDFIDKKLLECKDETVCMDFSTGSVVYLIKIKEGIYKFGETDNIKSRLRQHKIEFDYETEVGIFRCPHKTASQAIEKKIKDVLRPLGYLIEYPFRNDPQKMHKELFKYDGDISLICKAVENIVADHNIDAIESVDRYYLLACELKRSKIDEMDMKNKQITANNDLVKYDETLKSNQSILRHMQDMSKRMEELTTEVELLRRENQILKDNTKFINIETLIVKKPFNSPNIELDINIDSLVEFVKRSFKLVPGNKYGKDMLIGRFKTTIYYQYFNTAATTKTFFCTLFSSLETIFGMSPKQPSENEKYIKDWLYNYEPVYVSFDNFVDQKCVRADGASENSSMINIAYKNYCMELNSFGYSIDLSNNARQNGYTTVKNSLGERYRGLYLKDNYVNKFIISKCNIGGDLRCTQTQFVSAYNVYCRLEGLENVRRHDKLSVMVILRDLGYAAETIRNGCIDIIGIEVIGEKYKRTKPIPKKIVKNNVDEKNDDPNDNIAED